MSFFGACTGSLDLPERGYHFTATTTGVTVKVTSTTNVGLYATLGCGDPAVPVSCTDAVFGAGDETLTFPTQPGDNLTFFVELGAGGDPSADFVLDVTEL